MSEALAVDEHWTDDALQALALASREAQRWQHDSIRTEHILLGLIQQGGVAAAILKDLGLDLARVREQVEAALQPGTEPGTTRQPGPSRLAKAVLKAAGEEARRLALTFAGPGYRVIDCQVGAEHLLLGLLGAVTGLVKVFGNIGSGAMSTSDLKGIASGIGEALSTTIVGLAIAIPALVSYTYFSRRVERLAVEMESLLTDLIEKIFQADRGQETFASEGESLEGAAR